MKIGNCVHLDCATEFICTQGKHQNYPCPYKGNAKSKCPIFTAITTEMAEQWKSKGYIRIPEREMKGEKKLCFTKYDSS